MLYNDDDVFFGHGKDPRSSNILNIHTKKIESVCHKFAVVKCDVNLKCQLVTAIFVQRRGPIQIGQSSHTLIGGIPDKWTDGLKLSSKGKPYYTTRCTTWSWENRFVETPSRYTMSIS
jgi:hypothetical protein